MRITLSLVFLAAVSAARTYAADYVPGPDSQREPGVPKGAITQQSRTSRVYPDTVHDYWIYVRAQHDPQKPACVTTFKDGGGRVTEAGAWRADCLGQPDS